MQRSAENNRCRLYRSSVNVQLAFFVTTNFKCFDHNYSHVSLIIRDFVGLLTLQTCIPFYRQCI